MTAIYAYMIGNIFHAAVHMALLGLFSYLCLQLVVFIDPELPFSRPPQKGKNSALTIVLMFYDRHHDDDRRGVFGGDLFELRDDRAHLRRS